LRGIRWRRPDISSIGPLLRRLTFNRLGFPTPRIWKLQSSSETPFGITLGLEFARVPKYDAWKEIRYEGLRKRPLFLFISEGGKQGQTKNKIGLRQFLMHIGGNRLTLSVALSVLLTMSGKVSVRTVVIRGQPWYRRSPRILWGDAVRPIREWLGKVRQEFAARSARAPAKEGTTNVEHTFYFDDPNWNTQPAREIVRQYLDLMEREVDEAEKKFT
jgi:hypothetical protein